MQRRKEEETRGLGGRRNKERCSNRGENATASRFMTAHRKAEQKGEIRRKEENNHGLKRKYLCICEKKTTFATFFRRKPICGTARCS